MVGSRNGTDQISNKTDLNYSVLNWTALTWSQKAYDVSNAAAEEADAVVLGAAADEAEADAEDVVASCGDPRQGIRDVYYAYTECI